MQGGPHAAGRAAALARLAPLLILIPVAAGIAVGFARLLQTTHPVYGWSMSINADAEAIYLGQWPFRDPADGFTGDAYTPLYPALVSVLHHIKLWTGWPIVVTLLSAFGIAAMIAGLAYTPPARRTAAARLAAVGQAAGMGALGASFVFGLQRSSFYEARPDHFTWLLAFGAILLIPRAARGGVGPKAAVVVLLTLAFWAKQTALITAVAFCGVVLLLVLGGRIRASAAAAWAAALVLLNAGIVVTLDALTHGWQSRFNFDIALPVTRSLGDIVPDAFARVSPALAFLAGFAALAWVAAGRPRPTAGAPRAGRWLREASDRSMIAVGLGLMALLGAAAGVYTRRYLDGDDNNLIPMLWALGGLCALAYRAAAARDATAVAAGVGIVLAFASTFAPGDGRWRLRGGDFVPEQTWSDLPPAIEALASRKLLWDPLLSDLNVAHQRVIHPNTLHIQEALMRGSRPRVFERALLGRRFGGIFGLSSTTDDRGGFEGVEWEDGYFWKINQVILLKYRAAPQLPRLPAGEAYTALEPSVLRVPRAGPDPAPWVDNCFSPFRLLGREFRIHRGGGFWCAEPGGVLAMRGTPAALTELVSTGSLRRVRGVMRTVQAARAGGWRVELDGGWTVSARVSSAAEGVTVSAGAPGSATRSVVVDRAVLHRTRGRITFVLAPGRRVALARGRSASTLRLTLPEPHEPAKLHFWATRGSDPTFDLRGLRVD